MSVEYTDSLGDQMFLAISSGNTIDALCEVPGMPAQKELIGWIEDPTHPFHDLYKTARSISLKAAVVVVQGDPEASGLQRAAVDWLRARYPEI